MKSKPKIEIKAIKVKVLNGTIMVNGHHYIAMDSYNDRKVLNGYNNSYVIVKGNQVFEPSYLDGKFIGNLEPLSDLIRHREHYMGNKLK